MSGYNDEKQPLMLLYFSAHRVAPIQKPQLLMPAAFVFLRQFCVCMKGGKPVMALAQAQAKFPASALFGRLACVR